MSVADLRKSRMMAHLMDALSRGEDIGHYGRLVFVMVCCQQLSLSYRRASFAEHERDLAQRLAPALRLPR